MRQVLQPVIFVIGGCFSNVNVVAGFLDFSNPLNVILSYFRRLSFLGCAR
jgi:hypothetical protein